MKQNIILFILFVSVVNFAVGQKTEKLTAKQKLQIYYSTKQKKDSVTKVRRDSIHEVQQGKYNTWMNSHRVTANFGLLYVMNYNNSTLQSSNNSLFGLCISIDKEFYHAKYFHSNINFSSYNCFNKMNADERFNEISTGLKLIYRNIYIKPSISYVMTRRFTGCMPNMEIGYNMSFICLFVGCNLMPINSRVLDNSGDGIETGSEDKFFIKSGILIKL